MIILNDNTEKWKTFGHPNYRNEKEIKNHKKTKGRKRVSLRRVWCVRMSGSSLE